MALAWEIFIALIHQLNKDTNGKMKLPHLIICHLNRSRLDANRDLQPAALGQKLAEDAWHDWHNFIEISKRRSGAIQFKFSLSFSIYLLNEMLTVI
jgi:hypothetical protein